MVHALKEIRRVLAPGGILIDVRPLAGDWPVEIVARGQVFAAGPIRHLPQGYTDDEAANAAAAQAGRAGWFIREREDSFDFGYYWDTPGEMKAYIDAEWSDYMSVPEATLTQAHRLSTNAGAQVRLRLDMIISRWRKT
jgi:SAM-dependent methyltransferase